MYWKSDIHTSTYTALQLQETELSLLPNVNWEILESCVATLKHLLPIRTDWWDKIYIKAAKNGTEFSFYAEYGCLSQEPVVASNN